MAEITDKGITGRSLNDYLTDLKNGYLTIDPEWNIDNDTPDGQIIGIQSEMFTDLDEGLVAAYKSKDPDSATGEALNDIGKINALTRQAATFSIAPVNVTGVAGTVIAATTSQVRSRVDNTVWAVNDAIVIGSGGTGSGFVTCVTGGRINAAPGELTVIGTPLSGWSSVNNPLAATAGSAGESDTAFRARRERSVALSASNTVDAIYAAVADVPGVTDVKIFENDRYDPVDVNGIPIHSIAVVVNGGSDAAIALAMYRKKSPGCQMYPRYSDETDSWIDTPGPGAIKEIVTSPVTGNVATMTFQRAIAKQIFVKIAITRIGSLPTNIEDLIKAAIIADSTKDLFPENSGAFGFNQGGYDIGEVVPVGRQYTPVNKVLGLYGDSYVSSLAIGTTATNTGQAPVQPAYNELATFDADNIAITIS